MVNHIIGIDHALIAVRDLGAAAAVYTDLGFTLTPVGGHAQWGTANRCVMFPGDYLELLTASGAGPVAERISAFLDERGDGLMALSFGTGDEGAAVADLRRAGIAASEPRSLSRSLTTPEGEVMPRFSIVDLPPESTPGAPAFLCRHLTPELLRRPEWLDHPNGAVGLASVTVAVDSPEQAMAAYQVLFGAGNVTATDDTVAVHTGNGLILLCKPDDVSQLHPEVDDTTPPAPAIVAAVLRVRDTGQTARVLKANGVAFSRDPEGTVRVAAEDACGVYLEFVRSA